MSSQTKKQYIASWINCDDTTRQQNIENILNSEIPIYVIRENFSMTGEFGKDIYYVPIKINYLYSHQYLKMFGSRFYSRKGRSTVILVMRLLTQEVVTEYHLLLKIFFTFLLKLFKNEQPSIYIEETR